jgi:hypothetical protein
MEVLPVEIVPVILSYLSLDELAAAVCCKSWQGSYLSRCYAITKITTSRMLATLQRFPNITSLTVTNYAANTYYDLLPHLITTYERCNDCTDREFSSLCGICYSAEMLNVVLTQSFLYENTCAKYMCMTCFNKYYHKIKNASIMSKFYNKIFPKVTELTCFYGPNADIITEVDYLIGFSHIFPNVETIIIVDHCEWGVDWYEEYLILSYKCLKTITIL